MTGGIYLIQDDGQLVEMTEQAYDSEALLQRLLVDYPSLLAGDQIDRTTPRRWLLIKPEMEVPSEEDGYGRWFVDHLFLDQDGIPTIVEVKRSCDTRIRREVVGQMLDYASNAVVYWSIEKIIAQFEANCQTRGLEPNKLLSDFLVPDNKIEYTIFDLIEDDTQISDFWQKVKDNLQIGKIRLVFVADKIPSELQRIIEFLNKQMNPAEVIGVEIKQFAGQNLKTLIPRVIGQTVEAKTNKSFPVKTQHKWNEELFLSELMKNYDIDKYNTVKRIIDWANVNVSRIWWGEGSLEYGSFVPILVHNQIKHQLFSVFMEPSKTRIGIELYFQWYSSKPPFHSEEKRLELLSRLNSIEGASISTDRITKRPNIALSLLKEESTLQCFLRTFNWFIQEVKSM